MSGIIKQDPLPSLIISASFCGTRNLPTYSGTNVQDFCGEDSYIGREKGFEAYHKELKECEIRIAVYRDPIDKIIAGFYYCQEHVPSLQNLDHFLDRPMNIT